MKEQLKQLKKYKIEVIKSIHDTVNILEKNYGIRDVEQDLGGYVVIAENYIKELKRDEVRFCVYKATRRGDETYIPRSLDVTELELIELIKEKTKLRERLKKQANLITQIEALQYKS